MPGWYGVANVKWLSQIHVQADPFTGKFQTRWYRTIRGEMIDGETTYMETAVTHMQLKSFISRVTKNGAQCTITGVVLNDGTPLKSVDVKVDDGPWRAAAWDPATKEKYGWKLFTLRLARRDAGRPRHRVARDGRHREGAADAGGERDEEVVSRGQLAAARARSGSRDWAERAPLRDAELARRQISALAIRPRLPLTRRPSGRPLK